MIPYLMPQALESRLFITIKKSSHLAALFVYNSCFFMVNFL